MASTPTVKDSGTKATTVGTTPDTLLTTTDAGTYILTVDCNALVDDEVLVIEIARKVLTAGTVRTAYSWTVVGTLPANDKIQVSVPITAAFGADFKINQRNGSTRDIPWEVIQP